MKEKIKSRKKTQQKKTPNHNQSNEYLELKLRVKKKKVNNLNRLLR
jgi:hypothetical protein